MGGGGLSEQRGKKEEEQNDSRGWGFPGNQIQQGKWI